MLSKTELQKANELLQRQINDLKFKIIEMEQKHKEELKKKDEIIDQLDTMILMIKKG